MNIPSDTAGQFRELLGQAVRLADNGRLDEARELCDRAIALDGQSPIGFAILASVLIDQDRIADAAEAARLAISRAPRDPALLNLASGVALRLGQAGFALDHAEACLALAPGNARAVAHAAIALAQLGRDDEAGTLLDFDRLLKIVWPPAPPGFASVEEFNAALVAALTGRPDLSTRHVARTLVGGARLEDSFALDAPLADGLRALFADAAQVYLATLAVEPDHPMAQGKPEGGLRLSSWSNVMDGMAFELPHMHEGTWLSGVYYPEIAPAAGDGGAIEFGGHDFGAALKPGPVRRVMPRPGMLVLFPSYFYHRTIPLAAPGRRISIAFDVK